MSGRVRWTRRGLKDLRKLDRPVRQRVSQAIERFADTGAGDLRRLTDVEPPEWRLRVGDWRVRLRLEGGRHDLVILRVLPRDKAY